MSIKKTLPFLIFVLLFISVNVYALNKAVVDITIMDIKELSKALDKRLITSEELIKLYLDRINEFDEQYNSIITINEKAIEEAVRLDGERSAGNVRSSLHGIPLVVKDNIDVVGMPTTAGARALRDNHPRENAPAIQKLVDAGAIIIAKTNMSEFGFYASSSHSSFGTVKNAFSTAHASYGSSGGSAVAVAASFAAAALGTDTNSSVRIPAGANNVIGLRPTVGLISRTGVLPYDIHRDTIGPMTRTIADSIILMNIINGHDERDFRSINQPQRTYQTTFTNLNDITIGVPTRLMRGSNNFSLPENRATYRPITELMEQALANLEEVGATIVYIEDYFNNNTDYWANQSLSGWTFCNGFNEYIKGTVGRIRTFQQLASATEKVTPLGSWTNSCGWTSNMAAENRMKNAYREYIENIMTTYSVDVIAYPPSSNKVTKVGENASFINLSFHAAATINYPAIVMPLGFDDDGLPYGIELMAPTNQEELLLNIASIFEKVNGNNKKPDIAPALYEVPEVVQTLVDNYSVLFEKEKHSSAETKWLESVQEYFRAYSENENYLEEAEELNQRYNQINFRENIINTGLNFIQWTLIVLVGLVILLLIRKKIRRTIRKLKKRRK